ncbi:MAG: cyclin family protein [Promethearchaeia archaeon]
MENWIERFETERENLNGQNVDYVDENEYPHDQEDDSRHYGDPKTQAISDISVMTKVNPNECNDPELKRRLKWDGCYGWGVQKTEIIFQEIRRLCSKNRLGKDFRNDCFHFFHKYCEDGFSLSGIKTEDFGVALTYLVARINQKPVTILDFDDPKKTYTTYFKIVKALDMFDRIPPQNHRQTISRAIYQLFEINDIKYEFQWKIISSATKLYKGIIEALGYTEENSVVDLVTYPMAGLPMIGAIVYLITRKMDGVKLTQDKCSENVNCSEVTLRKYIKKVQRFKESWGGN